MARIAGVDLQDNWKVDFALTKIRGIGWPLSKEGHTDAVGSEVYNNKLSDERAASVKEYLVNKFGISAKQISASGKGKSGLLDPSHPDSEVNRRVRIVASK